MRKDVKECEWCKKEFSREEKKNMFKNQRFCSHACAQRNQKNPKKLPLWELLRQNTRINKKTGCWEYLKGKANGGYGAFKLNGKKQRVHRLMYELKKGPIPPGFFLDHLCRNPPCCNPDHLEAVTVAENSRRGLNAKLNTQEVADIRTWLQVKEVTLQQIATAYCVSLSTMYHIKNRTTWREI